MKKYYQRAVILILFIPALTWGGVTILLDPGHGGEDEGATRFYYKGRLKKSLIVEKDLALSITKKIQHYLKKYHSVYMTRSLDRTVSLKKRAEMAETLKADLFISVHINTAPRKESSGFEIYYLDNHVDKAVKKVETLENKSLKGEELIINQILTDLVVQRTAKASLSLSKSIHGYLKRQVLKKYKVIDRGIKSGLFYVLAMSQRPGVLIEVGFMSNTRELKRMKSTKFQNDFAKSVALGIHSYIGKKFKKRPSLF